MRRVSLVVLALICPTKAVLAGEHDPPTVGGGKCAEDNGGWYEGATRSANDELRGGQCLHQQGRFGGEACGRFQGLKPDLVGYALT
ncbi:hypothetical protein ACVWWI_006293 [Bradyrhizobium sp. USDA 3686]|nr:hypothetical protein [Bradyrhizobium canariense]